MKTKHCCVSAEIKETSKNLNVAKKIVNVAVGVLRTGNQVLITSRPYPKSYSGYWEFPGGKIEENESIFEALIRELNEELGVIVKAKDCRFLTTILQHYEDKDINLSIVEVNKWSGELTSCEEQELHFHLLGEECQKSPLLPTTNKIFAILEHK